MQVRMRVAARLGAAVASMFLLGACTSGLSSGEPDDCADSPLLAQIRQESNLRLIVQLAGDFVSEVELDAEAVQEQRKRISDAQDQLLAQLNGTEFGLLRRFEDLPLLVVEVEEPALCVLLTSDLVGSVERDDAEPPTG
jgi:hypothetical protein